MTDLFGDTGGSEPQDFSLGQDTPSPQGFNEIIQPPAGPALSGPALSNSALSNSALNAPVFEASALSGPVLDGPVLGPADQDEADQLSQLDPLANRPHHSSWIVCIGVGLVMLALSALVWWLAVFTVPGQEYDDEVFRNFSKYLSNAPTLNDTLALFTISKLAIGICVATGLVAYLVAALRRRWWLLGQLVIYSAVAYLLGRVLKSYLPRPFLIHTESMRGNSAPSGHTIMITAAMLVLVCSVPRAWRAVSSLVGFLLTMAVACSVIDGRWHRPSDVIMGIFIAGGLALLMLAATRASGMDPPGVRMSSASVQICSTVFLTGGLLGSCYGVFLLWQMKGGLEIGAQWTYYGAHTSSVVLIASSAALVFGSVLALRQLTASPLSKIGLLGAPPTPPDSL